MIMYKYILILLLIAAICSNVQAQRMTPQQKAIEISAGALISRNMDHDHFLNLGMTINGRAGNYFLVAMEYSRMRHAYKDIKIPVENFLAEGGYSIRLLADRRKSFSLHTGITGLLGYESINRGDSVLFDGASIMNQGGLIYGGTVRLSSEMYISDRLILFAQGRSRAVFNTSVSKFRPSVGLGIRFNF